MICSMTWPVLKAFSDILRTSSFRSQSWAICLDDDVDDKDFILLLMMRISFCCWCFHFFIFVFDKDFVIDVYLSQFVINVYLSQFEFICLFDFCSWWQVWWCEMELCRDWREWLSVGHSSFCIILWLEMINTNQSVNKTFVLKTWFGSHGICCRL